MDDGFTGFCIVACLIFIIFVLGAMAERQFSISHGTLIKEGFGQYNMQTGDFELIPLKAEKNKHSSK